MMKRIIELLSGKMTADKLTDLQRLDPLVFMKFGSKLYGTNVEGSDDDYRGVFIPTVKELVYGRAPAGLTTSTRKNREGHKNGPKDVDLEFYSLYRFLELVSEGQTVAFDMLFTPANFIIESTPVWQDILSVREKLLNKRCAASIGYARAQADRYSLRGDRMATLERVMELLQPYYEKNPRLTIAEFIDDLMARRTDPTVGIIYNFFDAPQREFVEIVRRPASHLEEGEEDLLKVCGKAVGFYDNVKKAYLLWQQRLDGYGDRAKRAKEGGADWKAMYHAVRVYHEAIELLTTHTVTLPRPEAPLLLKIRRAELTPQAVSEMIEEGIHLVYEAQEKSTLPFDTSPDVIDDLVFQHHGRKLKYSDLLVHL